MTSHDAVQHMPNELLSRVDHLVYASPELNRGIDELENLLGVRASAGGQHPGGGTRNALISLGPTVYLEVFAPDPDQPPPAQPRPFGLDALNESRLVAWFVKGTGLEQLRDEAVRKGVPLGAVKAGSRRRPDGLQLSWQFTDPWAPVADGVVPFFIDWGASPHPAGSAVQGGSLAGLSAEHPDAQGTGRMLRSLGLEVTVNPAAHAALIATIDGPRGRVVLR